MKSRISNIRRSTKIQVNGAVLKRHTRHKIVYDGSIVGDIEVVMLAMSGMTTKAIAQETGLSPTQVQYRISKAQRGEGLEIGYRAQWRSGSSPWLKQFRRVVQPAMAHHIKTTLPKKFTTPPVEASRHVAV